MYNSCSVPNFIKWSSFVSSLLGTVLDFFCLTINSLGPADTDADKVTRPRRAPGTSGKGNVYFVMGKRFAREICIKFDPEYVLAEGVLLVQEPAGTHTAQ